MKTTIIILLLTVAACVSQNPQPSQICVNIAASDSQRVAQAFGSILGLTNQGGQPRPATDAEISNAAAVWIGQQTQDYERRQNMKEFIPPPFDPSSGGGRMNGLKPAGNAMPSPTPKKKSSWQK